MSQSQARIDNYSARPEIIQMLTETKFCLTCRKRLPQGHGHKRITGYCCEKHYYDKPPKMAYLEHIYGKPIKEIIIETLNKNNNVTVSAELLGVSKFTIFQWLKKLNINRHVEWR